MKKSCLNAVLACLAAIQLNAAAVSPAPYGINVHLAGNDTLARVRAAGITWIRIDINWDRIEPSKGQFYFAEVDRVVGYAAANGLSVLASIAYTPAWANGEKENWTAYPASDVNDWRDFVARVIGRYNHAVRYWSVWNEPNLRDFFAPGKDVFVQRVLLPAAQVIRSVDPAAFIVGPELSHKTETGMEWYFWLKYILDNAGPYFDVISHHLYEDLGVYYMYELLEKGDNLLPAVRQIIEEAGQGGKPFWITETGWNTSKFSEDMQSSRYLELLQSRSRKDYPQKIFFYEIIDDPDPGVSPWGIIRRDGEAKPAYHVYRDYITGLYPDPGEPENDISDKKCYAEQAVTIAPANGGAQALQTLRNLRDALVGHSAGAREKVRLYYEWNQAFFKIALADSRVAGLGREILIQAMKISRENNGVDVNQPLPAALFAKIAALLKILASDHRTTPFGRLAARLRENPAALGRMPLHEWLELDLPAEAPAAKPLP
ncbi:MAG TPA: cellulase family glycosylhydrolase [Candidatus Binatia bacterium]|nr:cellulase family glycosylhydrolase [Candidatus Binatia bacterium]